MFPVHSARAPARRDSIRPAVPAATGLPPAIGWLRRVRRSAWLLIVLCLGLRVAAAMMPDTPLGHAGAAAAAAQAR